MAEPKSLTQIISEKDFLALAEVPCKQFFNVSFFLSAVTKRKKISQENFIRTLFKNPSL